MRQVMIFEDATDEGLESYPLDIIDINLCKDRDWLGAYRKILSLNGHVDWDFLEDVNNMDLGYEIVTVRTW